MDEEVSKAKEYLSRSNHEDALKVMEAVTEEIVQRASSISGKVGNLREVMDWLGKEWIDMFLSSLFELQEDEKEDWFEKLRTWDTLFSDEESHFSCAKHAARHMWDNAKLQFILHGGHNETAAQRIAGFFIYFSTLFVFEFVIVKNLFVCFVDYCDIVPFVWVLEG